MQLYVFVLGGFADACHEPYIFLNIASKKAIQQEMMSFLQQSHRTCIYSYDNTNLQKASAATVKRK
jgi:hypothetical protein